MFDALTAKLTGVFQRLSGKGHLSEKDVDEALREVRVALLEADVNFRVARDLVARVREKLLGVELQQGLNPAQQVVKVVNDELTAVLSGGDHKLKPSPQAPTIIMLVGLQGSGKTTTAAKLALNLRRSGTIMKPLLIAADLRRPAAVDQLASLAKQLDMPVYTEAPATSNALKAATNGVRRAKDLDAPWAIVDTGGRLQIDEELMQELVDIKQAVNPHEILLVVDAMTGQDAVQVAGEFHKQLGLTGLILTKMDGDARGGAALSITAVIGVPIKFIGIGEKPDGLEPFFPDRMASRILGMGDVLSLVEKAEAVIDEKKARELEKKLRQSTFDLQDFLDQLKAVRKMGSLGQLMDMIPGMGAIKKRLPNGGDVDEYRLKQVEAIVLSMTARERRSPDVLDASRKRRVAKGSGTAVQDVNQLLNQFREMQKMMKQFAKMKPKQIEKMMKGTPGAPQLPRPR
ncbi:MAG: signal recognition particle protein [Dehalococcoidia bacterium]|nr:signal recognition particle protein [Dehalococcoidia bacterium]